MDGRLYVSAFIFMNSLLSFFPPPPLSSFLPFSFFLLKIKSFHNSSPISPSAASWKSPGQTWVFFTSVNDGSVGSGESQH